MSLSPNAAPYGYVRPLDAPKHVLPRPVGLHWGWVLVLCVLTRNFFELIWLIVQANWVRKVMGGSKAFIWSIVLACFLPAMILLAVAVGILSRLMHQPVNEMMSPVLVFLFLGFIGVRLVTIYQLRSEMAQSPINLELGGVMTFFFGAIYFQYHLHDFDFGTSPLDTGSTLGLSGIVQQASVSNEPIAPAMPPSPG